MKVRPLNRSFLIVCLLFFALLSLVLSLATYQIYTATMFDRYQKQMASILTYVESHTRRATAWRMCSTGRTRRCTRKKSR